MCVNKKKCLLFKLPQYGFKQWEKSYFIASDESNGIGSIPSNDNFTSIGTLQLKKNKLQHSRVVTKPFKIIMIKLSHTLRIWNEYWLDVGAFLFPLNAATIPLLSLPSSFDFVAFCTTWITSTPELIFPSSVVGVGSWWLSSLLNYTSTMKKF